MSTVQKSNLVNGKVVAPQCPELLQAIALIPKLSIKDRFCLLLNCSNFLDASVGIDYKMDRIDLLFLLHVIVVNADIADTNCLDLIDSLVCLIREDFSDEECLEYKRAFEVYYTSIKTFRQKDFQPVLSTIEPHKIMEQKGQATPAITDKEDLDANKHFMQTRSTIQKLKMDIMRPLLEDDFLENDAYERVAQLDTLRTINTLLSVAQSSIYPNFNEEYNKLEQLLLGIVDQIGR